MQFVEAHGTGTPVGDPIEARALGPCSGWAGRKPSPCVIGSVKTNIGHLEAAAGIAGLIKAALALKHRQIPANLHFKQVNPEIPLRSWVCESREAGTLARDEGPGLAGINSFGFGGTNGHAILEEWKPGRAGQGKEWAAETASSPTRMLPQAAQLIPVSARSELALVESARDLADWLDGEGGNVPFDVVCRSSAAMRRQTTTSIGWHWWPAARRS